MSLQLQGLNKTLKNLGKNAEKYIRKTETATMKAGLHTETLVKQKTPVDTGNLRSSVHARLHESKKEKASSLIGTNIEYAPYLEFGTRKMKAQAMFRKTISEDKKKIFQTFKKNML